MRTLGAGIKFAPAHPHLPLIFQLARFRQTASASTHTPKINVSERDAIYSSLRRGFSRLQPRSTAPTSCRFPSRSMTGCAISSSRYSLLPRRPMRREASRCMSTS